MSAMFPRQGESGKHVTGVDVVIRGIGKARAKDARSLDEGLQLCAQKILERSDYYVPVETGELENSGRVEGNGKSGFGAQYTVIYGITTSGSLDPGTDAYYALYVHEDLTATHDHPTCAKFLERATRETRNIRSRILSRQFVDQGGLHVDGKRKVAFDYKSPKTKAPKPPKPKP